MKTFWQPISQTAGREMALLEHKTVNSWPEKLDPIKINIMLDFAWHVSASLFHKNFVSRCIGYFSTITGMNSLCMMGELALSCLKELLLEASHPSSFQSALSCNKTQRQNIVQVSLRRGKLPFMVAKTREQNLVNKHVTVWHGIHRLLLLLCLPFVGRPPSPLNGS